MFDGDGQAQGDIVAILSRAGLVSAEARPPMQQLTGGVSSDIWRVQLADRDVCVKRALAKLKVRADWRAPVERSRFEASWLRTVGRFAPEAAPPVLYFDQPAGALVMPYLDPARHYLWKNELRDGHADPEIARMLGERLGHIHAATALDPKIAAEFATDGIFHAIRLEPYLLATAERHPDLKTQLTRIARRTATTKLTLVHGDVSPKNIMIGPDGPLLIDAECAWFGDPAFDIAFCLNHMLLKCLWARQAVPDLLDCFDALLEAYMTEVVWEPRGQLEARVATLLPALLLARIDGKSPVEYITEETDKALVRRVATSFVMGPSPYVSPIRIMWESELER